MPDRRQLLKFTGTALLWPILSRGALAQGGAAALSAPITGQVRLRMRATSLTQHSRWGIYVQEVVIRNDLIVPLALISCFEFGREQDPAVYAQISSPPLPVAAAEGEPYRVAVYFFENREVKLQPHSDAALLANRFEEAHDEGGRTTGLKASYWDNANVPNANIHEISIVFDYVGAATPGGAKLQ